jgi:hypothetical protein
VHLSAQQTRQLEFYGRMTTIGRPRQRPLDVPTLHAGAAGGTGMQTSGADERGAAVGEIVIGNPAEVLCVMHGRPGVGSGH